MINKVIDSEQPAIVLTEPPQVASAVIDIVEKVDDLVLGRRNRDIPDEELKLGEQLDLESKEIIEKYLPKIFPVTLMQRDCFCKESNLREHSQISIHPVVRIDLLVGLFEEAAEKQFQLRERASPYDCKVDGASSDAGGVCLHPGCVMDGLFRKTGEGTPFNPGSLFSKENMCLEVPSHIPWANGRGGAIGVLKQMGYRGFPMFTEFPNAKGEACESLQKILQGSMYNLKKRMVISFDGMAIHAQLKHRDKPLVVRSVLQHDHFPHIDLDIGYSELEKHDYFVTSATLDYGQMSFRQLARSVNYCAQHGEMEDGCSGLLEKFLQGNSHWKPWEKDPKGWCGHHHEMIDATAGEDEDKSIGFEPPRWEEKVKRPRFPSLFPAHWHAPRTVPSGSETSA